ncbi:dol-P-Glc:Glc(2)Man(9)GlcNAc(2)-PP-Dol alpha-1,2-glucosyltransferase isoform X2 [Pleurodeles waltl]|uniref:dol-P-Glc:Glc(2)Man(9)GlcNAc(2)-PP-Dol alpha-1,2-glucosyltransferase isoform X2 n=1 Tax=Pleurodeles waltl TaxID=8319 RepID=UPI003709966D
MRTHRAREHPERRSYACKSLFESTIIGPISIKEVHGGNCSILFQDGVGSCGRVDAGFAVAASQYRCNQLYPAQWDPMITTLPGLYLVSIGIVKPTAWLLGWTGRVVCSTAMLRFVNLLFSVGNLYLLYSIICKIHYRDKGVTSFKRILSAFTLSMFPVLYFFTFLYYTDTGSTFFVLFSYLMCLSGNHKAAALLGFGAVWFRQTNIIWTLFCGGGLAAERLTEAWTSELKKDDRHAPLKGSLSEVARGIQFLINHLMKFTNLKALIFLTWPYLVVVFQFFFFVAVNGGIVVGDRSNHEACLNVPQVFYFLAFTLAFSSPCLLLSPRRIQDFLQSVWRQPVRYAVLTAAFLLLVWKCTHVHKYLLADNRHYTFYIWQRIFQKHALAKFVAVPVYVFAGWSFVNELKSKSVFWNLMFLACLLAATIPQKLLEFRYFILPYLIYRLNVNVPSVPKLLLELALYSAVNAVTLHFFLNRTFQWPDSEETQRFMW